MGSPISSALSLGYSKSLANTTVGAGSKNNYSSNKTSWVRKSAPAPGDTPDLRQDLPENPRAPLGGRAPVPEPNSETETAMLLQHAVPEPCDDTFGTKTHMTCPGDLAPDLLTDLCVRAPGESGSHSLTARQLPKPNGRTQMQPHKTDGQANIPPPWAHNMASWRETGLGGVERLLALGRFIWECLSFKNRCQDAL